MLREITYRQLLEWMAFAELEPFDGSLEAVRLGEILQVLLNANRDTKKRRKAFELRECIVGGGDNPAARQKQSWQDQKAIMMMHSAMNQTLRA